MTESSNNTDDFILSLLQASNPLAIQHLYNLYYKTIYRYLKKFMHTEDEAHDLTQELFIAIWIKRHSLNLTKPLQHYLIKAAHNKALNHLRNNERKLHKTGNIIHRTAINSPPPVITEKLDAQELDTIIKQSLLLLPPKARKTFIMSRKLGMTYKEIANHLNVSEKAVEKNMSKALSLLRLYLNTYLKIVLICWNYS